MREGTVLGLILNVLLCTKIFFMVRSSHLCATFSRAIIVGLQEIVESL